MKTLIQLFCAWFKMGIFTFGGGYAMLPMIQKEVIEKYHWATEDEVMDYYAIGQCTPGIIAVNTAKRKYPHRYKPKLVYTASSIVHL